MTWCWRASTSELIYFRMLTGAMPLHNNFSILYGLWSGANTVRNLSEHNNITMEPINNANSTSQQRDAKYLWQVPNRTWHFKRTVDATYRRNARRFPFRSDTNRGWSANAKRIRPVTINCRPRPECINVATRTKTILWTNIIWTWLLRVANL